MTENSMKVLEFLQRHSDKEFIKHELVEELDIPISAVTGSINGLIKKGLAKERIETYAPLYSGSKATEVRWVRLTEEGKVFDPIEEERQKKRKQAEATALRKQARALEKAERAKRNSVL